jgi:hypothetical protein
MADLYSTLGANSTRRVLTQSDVTGPETTWLVIYNNDQNWVGGESFNSEPEVAASDSVNYRAIVECIQQHCEVYEVIRPSWGILSLKVRLSSVPYSGSETKMDQGQNSILTGIVQAHPDLGSAYTVYNGRVYGNQIYYD